MAIMIMPLIRKDFKIFKINSLNPGVQDRQRSCTPGWIFCRNLRPSCTDTIDRGASLDPYIPSPRMLSPEYRQIERCTLRKAILPAIKRLCPFLKDGIRSF